MKLGPHCFTIPADTPFIKGLAGWILEAYGHDAAGLTKLLVLLPNRRACRALREAFLDITAGKPLLLPRIQPIGDMEEDRSASYFEAADGVIPPAISPIRRELILTRLVQEIEQGRDENIEHAAELARQLARFMDDAAREGLKLDSLSALVPQELAIHWQQSLDFLTVILHHWPKILEAEGAIDPVDRRNRLLAAAAKHWRDHPPSHPVIAAGSTGSQPATAELLSVIAGLQNGMVILPGLDTAMPENEWIMVGETHPQYGLKQLLEKMECKRAEVQPLPSLQSERRERMECLRAILSPPEATAGWAQAQLPLAEGLKGIKLLTADTLLDEARMIAIALREVLETPEKTAALVTPDRNLARMVAAQMQRFGIVIDDSAGRPLKDTAPGCFLRLAADMVASRAAPAELLALLRHPLAAAGMNTADCRRLSRKLETDLLRGVRRTPGLEALSAATQHAEVKSLLDRLAQHARPLAQCFRQEKAPLSALLAAHMAFAEWLATTDQEAGAERLWAGDAGNDLAAFLAELIAHADKLESVDPFSYPALFETLLGEQVWRPRYGLHPRLHILSPIEARLLQFDRVILGGLNEGGWPAAPAADPWMSRPMRAAFGLPAAERAIGQSAHDIMLLSASSEIILSRARKMDGTPAVASRWLVRLETLVAGLDKNYFAQMNIDAHYEQGKRLLDAPLALPPLVRPEPKPPLDARPRSLRVTAIDNWLRDPYVIYARYILGLRKLEPLDEEPDAADFGNLVHNAMERFVGICPGALPADALAVLLECGREAFSEYIDRPGVACLWWPRFESMAGWIIEREKERRPALAKVLGELKGRWQFMVDGKPFTLTTSIDRLEIAQDGTVSIADYKTGFAPGESAVEKGQATQLPLEALIVLQGLLEPAMAAPATVAALEYWKLTGNPAQCKITTLDGTIDELLATTWERLESLVQRFDNAATPYAAQSDPSLQVKYNDYEHLARRQEWETI